MKLAEALMERSDCQTRIRELRERIVRNARVQEGETPSEDPTTLLTELRVVIGRFETLIRLINKTNAVVEIAGIGTVTDALARRDILGKHVQLLREVAIAGAATHDRFTRSELKTVSTVNIAGLQQEADLLSRQWRELDTKVQAVNWSADLLD